MRGNLGVMALGENLGGIWSWVDVGIVAVPSLAQGSTLGRLVADLHPKTGLRKGL